LGTHEADALMPQPPDPENSPVEYAEASSLGYPMQGFGVPPESERAVVQFHGASPLVFEKTSDISGGLSLVGDEIRVQVPAGEPKGRGLDFCHVDCFCAECPLQADLCSPVPVDTQFVAEDKVHMAGRKQND